MARRLAREERGFTLMELMIVILLIAILAAIAIPMFLGKRDRADDTDAKAAARDLVTYMDACYTSKEDFTKCSTQADADANSLDWGAAPGQVRVTDATKTTYEVKAISNAATNGVNHIFTIRRSIGGPMVLSCTAGAQDNAGGCKNGAW
jgi:type IV pilus assembly protein PilA